MAYHVTFIFAVLATLNSVQGASIAGMQGAVDTINAKLQTKPGEFANKEVYSIKYVPELDKQAELCGNWVARQPPADTNMSPNLRNKDPSVLHIPERFYKDASNPDNSPYNLPPTVPNSNPHYNNFQNVKDVEDVVLAKLTNSNTWLIQGLIHDNLSGVSGIIQDRGTYFLTVTALEMKRNPPTPFSLEGEGVQAGGAAQGTGGAAQSAGGAAQGTGGAAQSAGGAAQSPGEDEGFTKDTNARYFNE